MKTDELIARARDLSAIATGGPWKADHTIEMDRAIKGADFDDSGEYVCLFLSEDDAKFVAASRELIPQLASTLERCLASRMRWYRLTEIMRETRLVDYANADAKELKLMKQINELQSKNQELAAIIECRDAQIKHHQRSWKINSDGRKQVTRKYDTLRNIAKRQVVRRKVAERVLAILVANGNVARHVVDAWTKYSVDLEKESHS